jgi:hypothetical protein
MAGKIGILESLTPMQARCLLNLYLNQAASESGDIERMIEGQIMLSDTQQAMSTEEHKDMINRINLLHRTVGCAEHCHDKVDDALTS